MEAGRHQPCSTDGCLGPAHDNIDTKGQHSMRPSDDNYDGCGPKADSCMGWTHLCGGLLGKLSIQLASAPLHIVQLLRSRLERCAGACRSRAQTSENMMSNQGLGMMIFLQ